MKNAWTTNLAVLTFALSGALSISAWLVRLGVEREDLPMKMYLLSVVEPEGPMLKIVNI